MRIAMVAGEASGDMLAAHLIGALKRQVPNADFVGIGGPQMQREGFDAWWPSERLAVRGYVEVLRHYRDITRIRRQLLSRLLDERPDVFIGVDAPDFNLWLEGRLKKRGIPAIHYVSPSVWAWRAKRLEKIGRSVSHLLALFPFEPDLYRQRNIPVTYVGHPLADVIPLSHDQGAVRERLDLNRGGPVFAILPGSRQAEVQFMGELLIETAKRLHARFPEGVFLVPLVSRETRSLFETAIWNRQAGDLPFKLLFGHARDALAACDAAIVASGTATLEAALFKVPMVVTYRMPTLTWHLMRRMQLQPWIALPNILAGRFVVPEFLQDGATPDNIAQAIGNLVTDAVAKAEIKRIFGAIHRDLRQNTAQKAAEAVLSYLAAGST